MSEAATTLRVTTALADVKETASAAAPLSSQLLFGEQVVKLGGTDEWLLVRNRTDAYEGFVHQSCLRLEQDPAQPTHRVTARSTLLFATPDIKSPIVSRLPFAATICARPEVDTDGDSRFLQTTDNGYIWKQHCEAVKAPGSVLSGLDSSHTLDIVSVSELLFLGAPYLWGGRSPDGFDCSGLVQMAAFATGVALPRDSAQQEPFLTHRVELEQARRADLVFWPGHVGMLVSTELLLHATAHSLDSLIEPLHDVVQRAGPISSIRRLPAGHGQMP